MLLRTPVPSSLKLSARISHKLALSPWLSSKAARPWLPCPSPAFNGAETDMPSALPPQQDSAFAALRQFARKRAPVERCEMCSLGLPPEHEHLVEPLYRKLICACDACAILFEGQ